MTQRPPSVSLAPEERLLDDKRAELAILEDTLAEREEELASLQAELAAFTNIYDARLGDRFAQLRRLQQKEAADVREPSTAKPPDPELKALFRAAAKAVHPDLANNDGERIRRTVAMAEINAAYSRGDTGSVRRVLAAFAHRPEDVSGDGVAAELVRVIRKLDRASRRVSEIATELRAIKVGPVFALFAAWRVEGDRMFTDIERDLDDQLKRLRGRRV